MACYLNPQSFLLFFLICAVLFLQIKMYLYLRKNDALENIFKKISDPRIPEKQKSILAEKAIHIFHSHKSTFTKGPIYLNIQNEPERIAVYHLLRAEILFLIQCLARRSRQAIYRQTVPPKQRKMISQIIVAAADSLEKINNSKIELPVKIELLIHGEFGYHCLVDFYCFLPDENGHQEFHFVPLFEIIDKTPIRTVSLFPYFPDPPS